MIVFLYGPDSYRRQQKVKDITKRYLKKYSGINVREFDLEEENIFPEFRDFVIGQSLFEQTKFAIVKNIFSFSDNKAMRKLLKENLSDLSTTLLINEGGAVPPAFLFLKKDPVRVQKFEKLDRDKTFLFIKKVASEKGISLPINVTNSLADIYAGDSWMIVNELEKLKLGNGENIKFSPAENFFGLLNSIGYSNKYRDKLPALERLFLKKESESKIFNMLASQCVRKKNRVSQFADYDVMVKSGRIDYETALLDFCLN